ncbi:DcrB-related protein [Escherichia fergusonii]|uniref:DcrB-related protein n=1 Tax=Escherichia fergusonii TaxID=564 RepID=UPI002017728D|nr:DcrB-related protein [Escherichia fergusonii]
MSTCKISGCLSYRILDSGPDGTQTTLTARETTATYLREPHTCYQRQIAVLLPEQRLLMLTCTVLNTFREEDEVFWQQVKNTLAMD